LFVPILKTASCRLEKGELPVKRRRTAKTPTDQQHKLQVRAFDLRLSAQSGSVL